MESKRKSNGADAEDRASKRQKTASERSQETPKTTTEVGLAFIEQIRRTGDKSGRRIAGYFEELLPKKGNAEYYKTIRMPISLNIIEKKLKAGDFATLAELESYVKRMVQNVKDFYPRSSQVFDDAERIRKATSNFMVKNNPAYKLIHGYSAIPTPIPDELLENDAEEEEGDAEGEEEDAEMADADGKEEEDDAEADADGDEDDADEGDDGDEDKDADGEDDAEGEYEEDEEETGRTPRRRGSVRRTVKGTPLQGRRKSSERAPSVSVSVSAGAKPDHEYDGVPYKGLTFQQAQEKVVEEVVRRPDEDDETYPYFEPFLNLPPRSLKDYFQVIKDPLSLKKLQKLVKGIRSRTDRSGVSEFKSWAAFEEKASLLWTNAYFYNEDGSPIAEMAKELEKMMLKELKQAKAVVPEPPQPKIKIKVAPGQETPVAGSKKITIHVANTRGSSAESPIPKTGSDAGANGVKALTSTPLDKARSASIVSASTPAAAKREESGHASPAQNGTAAAAAATAAPTNGAAASAATATATPDAATPAETTNGTPAPPPAPVVPKRPAYESKFRAAGREPLMTNVTFRTHPAINCGDHRFEIKLPPHPKLTQRSVTVNIPQGQWRQHLVVSLAPSIQQQQRPFKMFVIANGATLGQSAPLPSVGGTVDAAEVGGKLYEINLHTGVNVIQVQLFAGLPRDQKLADGSDAELEKLTIFANLMKY